LIILTDHTYTVRTETRVLILINLIMITTKHLLLLVLTLGCLYICGCKSKVTQSGEIHGIVSDAETNQPLAEAGIILNASSDTIRTSSDGSFLIKALQPGNYEIQVIKAGFMKKTVNTSVSPEKTSEVSLALNGAIKISDLYLDFGVESTTKNLTVSKTGMTSLKYTVSANQSWIEFSPASGELNNNSATIKVTIKKPGSSLDILKADIVINSSIGQETQEDKISVMANGALDTDLTYYKVVKIGDQYWTAENSHAGIIVDLGTLQNDYQTIKKYSVNPEYGGLYTWTGAMRGVLADNKAVGTTKGVCPVGWHIPTLTEWKDLINYLGEPTSGVKLKEAGETHWQKGNVATNESGFTAIPGGMWNGYTFSLLKSHAYFWTSSNDMLGHYYAIQFEYNAEKGFFQLYREIEALSVRCVKNP